VGWKPHQRIIAQRFFEAPSDCQRLLSFLKAGLGHFVFMGGMTQETIDTLIVGAMSCPACGQSMTLKRMIRRAFAENLEVRECKPCGLSVTQVLAAAARSAN
jgi:hypothetical protein